MTSDEIVVTCYAGAIRLSVLACRMMAAGIPEEEIIRRVRIAERGGPHMIPTDLIGVSEAIARKAIERWKAIPGELPS